MRAHLEANGIATDEQQVAACAGDFLGTSGSATELDFHLEALGLTDRDGRQISAGQRLTASHAIWYGRRRLIREHYGT